MQSFTYVLIPGAGGTAWYWHLVAPKLQELSHEAVPVQLPAADDRAGLPQYAAAVVRAIGDREPKCVALVAQSLAGFTVPLVCEVIPVAFLVLTGFHLKGIEATRARESKRVWLVPPSSGRALAGTGALGVARVTAAAVTARSPRNRSLQQQPAGRT